MEVDAVVEAFVDEVDKIGCIFRKAINPHQDMQITSSFIAITASDMRCSILQTCGHRHLVGINFRRECPHTRRERGHGVRHLDTGTGGE